MIGPLFKSIYGTRFVKEVTLQLPGVRDGQKGKRHAETKRLKKIYKFRCRFSHLGFYQSDFDSISIQRNMGTSEQLLLNYRTKNRYVFLQRGI